MLDRAFAAVGVLGLVAFMGIIAVYVMEPNLWFVVLVGVFIAVFFIWRDVAAAGNGRGGPRGDGDGGGA